MPPLCRSPETICYTIQCPSGEKAAEKTISPPLAPTTTLAKRCSAGPSKPWEVISSTRGTHGEKLIPVRRQILRDLSPFTQFANFARPAHRTLHNFPPASTDEFCSVRRPKPPPRPWLPVEATRLTHIKEPGALCPKPAAAFHPGKVSATQTGLSGPPVPIAVPLRSNTVTCESAAVPGLQANTPERETEKSATVHIHTRFGADMFFNQL